LLDNAAIGDAHDADPGLPSLVTPDRHPRGHLAAFAKHVIDGKMKASIGGAEIGNKLFESLAPFGHAAIGVVRDEVGSKQLVGDLKASLVSDLLNETLCDGLVLLDGHSGISSSYS
jgi:hypothetical protein